MPAAQPSSSRVDHVIAELENIRSGLHCDCRRPTDAAPQPRACRTASPRGRPRPSPFHGRGPAPHRGRLPPACSRRCPRRARRRPRSRSSRRPAPAVAWSRAAGVARPSTVAQRPAIAAGSSVPTGDAGPRAAGRRGRPAQSNRARPSARRPPAWVVDGDDGTADVLGVQVGGADVRQVLGRDAATRPGARASQFPTEVVGLQDQHVTTVAAPLDQPACRRAGAGGRDDLDELVAETNTALSRPNLATPGSR